MKKLIFVLPAVMMFSFFAAAVNAQEAKKAEAQPKAQAEAPAATPAVTEAAPQASTPATPAEAPKPEIADASVGVVAAVAKDGTVYVLKEFKVDVITTFTPEDIEKMKQEADADIKKIEAYVAQYNKADATEKEKKEATKYVKEVLNKRVDAYFTKFQNKIDYVNGLVKNAENEMKAEKKNKKTFVEDEAVRILSGNAPAFRVPDFDDSSAAKK